MITPQTIFLVKCESARTSIGQPKSPLCRDSTEVHAKDEAQALQVAQKADWGQIDGRDYCPACYKKELNKQG